MSLMEDEHFSDSDDGNGMRRTKRRKGPKACDVCRRKKIRCDPDPSGDPQRPCVNCAVFKTECTYTYIAKKRRTQQAFIDSLQDRVQKLESLLTSLAPDIDLSKELDDNAGLLASSSRSSLQGRHPRPPSPPKTVPRPPNPDINPSQVVSAFADWREPPSSEDDEEEEVISFIPVLQPPSTTESTSIPHRFHGKSSGVMLLKKVMGMKKTYTGTGHDPDPRDYAHVDEPWEARAQTTLDRQVSFKFPPQDLQYHLIDVFFRYINPYVPFLHRPSFEADVRDELHKRDPPFGAVLLLLCVAASRWSNDPRVLSQSQSDAEPQASWYSAGWDYYLEVQLRYRRNFLHTTSVRDLQMIALGCIYLQGTSNPSPSWHLAGLGLRLALDAGAHRRKRPGAGNKLEDEMWKRAFWVLVVLDRFGSVALGRPCAIWEEDIDTDLPIEVDDEYMTEEAGFTQPPDTPSNIAYFNSLVKLSQILIGALRTIYPISKHKSMFRVGANWEQDMVAALDSSLNSWLDGVPDHLRWDPNRPNVDVTFYQSALVNCLYYYVQIVVHRPYITRPPSSSLAFPSLAICTHAARSCSHILDVLLSRGWIYTPIINHATFASAIVLLFNIWGMNKPGARVDWQSQVKDVHTCMRYIEKTKDRWRMSQKMGKILRDLVCVGEFPLPQGGSPPFISGDPQSSHSGQKRPRDSENSPYTYTPATVTLSDSNESPGPMPGPSHGFIPDRIPFNPDLETHNFDVKPEDFAYSNHAQGPYPPGSSHAPDLGHLSLPDHSTLLQETPQNMYDVGAPPQQNDPRMHMDGHIQQQSQQHNHSARDVLTAFDSAYLVDSTSSLGDGVVMDVAQHTLDVWGTAPTGFQWDEWQQFTNIVQNGPGSGPGFSGF